MGSVPGVLLLVLLVVPAVYGVRVTDVAAARAGADEVAAFYPDLPIPAHTGGFGEATCHACHFDNPLNDPGGRLSLSGVPDVLQADSSYIFAIKVTHAEIGAAGFQLAVRAADGQNAGHLSTVDERSVVTERDGVAYVQHSRSGTALDGEQGRWEVEWTAPSTLDGAILVHVVGNAANGDRSEFGDYIYTLALRLGDE